MPWKENQKPQLWRYEFSNSIIWCAYKQRYTTTDMLHMRMIHERINQWNIKRLTFPGLHWQNTEHSEHTCVKETSCTLWATFSNFVVLLLLLLTVFQRHNNMYDRLVHNCLFCVLCFQMLLCQDTRGKKRSVTLVSHFYSNYYYLFQFRNKMKFVFSCFFFARTEILVFIPWNTCGDQCVPRVNK